MRGISETISARVDRRYRENTDRAFMKGTRMIAEGCLLPIVVVRLRKEYALAWEEAVAEMTPFERKKIGLEDKK